jgi:multiple antibiotic resistance protein
MYEFLRETLFFLILINPVSKIVILSTFSKGLKAKAIERILVESSVVALAILLVFAFGGLFILDYVFQIDISALMIAGGIVLAFFGFNAVNNGFFFQVRHHTNLMELAIVPLASPLIAGPATIAATIIKAGIYPPLFLTATLTTAITINFILMLFSTKIAKVLNRYNVSGALIRITGLFIMSIGVEMILNGIRFFSFA